MSPTILPYDSALNGFPVLGLPVHLTNNYTNWLLQRCQQELGTHVITLNAEMAIQAEKDPKLAEIIHSAELVIPDGAGVVLYLQYKGKKIQRCPGIELAETLIENIGKLDNSELVFFYGGKQGIAEQAADNIQQKLPGLGISSYHGYLSASEEEDLKITLKDLQPKLILVGLGVPRQEFWISQNRHLCPNSIWIGVGGSFDIWSGIKQRAPEFFCKYHLEWLYRLYQEPWRWRRMLALPEFAIKVLLKGTGVTDLR
ncbi:WecB/TagA/CpsF family glycosyltransferase [Planktothrix agardhii]|jgi:N-acetylglucosaminyldiphosphoundecaprenol N-acetyl-beta-D-mannosaminyltransferase|uniref:RffM n=2 Tax=Planktothrix agardhii TaxID=1160 RepID=A0A073CZ03_PLAA1|nr:WecB/TagA/CpsF family glycosyltransferase [Planktothrix agardhii]MCF3609288.1 WecB/TagA/CpsF family glycosyltransferase [Planktothrix agardhii 1033]BBD54194.1 UDP-N-acetyl-D-mannosaminuronic acid transferase [Planktothrix agardhii NIES-204]KEI69270.1 RffM [Planktothrix agardhii NIVA-CYA 126/8]MBG0748792.1 WecB/TagA/CpsF family glycosyltransferase [Planktothrix agardhii KL2]MCB8749139.1 WecB/TagA/CpsF family glycosyltransferase [Planktothrix agardhii 1810]